MPPLESSAHPASDSFSAPKSSQGSYFTSPPKPGSPLLPQSPSVSPFQSQSQSQSQSESQEEWWEIRCILGERIRNGRVEYKVDWAPHSVTGQTYDPDWIPGSQVTHAARQEWILNKHQRPDRARNQNKHRRQGQGRNQGRNQDQRPSSSHSEDSSSTSRRVAQSITASGELASAHLSRLSKEIPDSLTELNNTPSRPPSPVVQSAIFISSGSPQAPQFVGDAQAPIHLSSSTSGIHPAQNPSPVAATTTVATPSYQANLGILSITALEASNSSRYRRFTESELCPSPSPQVVSCRQQRQLQVEIPDSQNSSVFSTISPFRLSQPVDLTRLQPISSKAVETESQPCIQRCDSHSAREPQLAPTSNQSPSCVSQEYRTLNSQPANSTTPLELLLEHPQKSPSQENFTFLSQVPPQFPSEGEDLTSLLATFRSSTKSLGLDHITETPINPSSRSRPSGEISINPKSTPAIDLMKQPLPRTAHSLTSPEHGHKRTLSSPGSQPLVKRTRVIKGKATSIMDLDDSIPLSSMDELLNMQTPYDPTRPIIVATDDMESDIPLPEDAQKGENSMEMTFSLLQGSNNLLPSEISPSIVSEAPSHPMVSACDAPMISGAVNPSALEFGSAVNVNPDLMLPQQNPSLLTIAPSDISRSVDMPFEDHLRESPHLNTSPVQHPIKEDTVESLQSLDGDIIYDGEREFLVTLPFASSQRPLYIDVIEKFKAYNKSFANIFFDEEYQEPRASLVHQIDEEFVTLLDLCDYPHELASKSLSELSEKEVQHYAVESNAKFNFLWEFLHELEETENKILIVVRSEKLLRLLKAVISAEKIPVSTSTLDETDYSRSTSSLTVVLALHNSEIIDPISSFNAVIGFDYMFRFSTAARQINAFPVSKQPFVLTLMMLHSIEHLDISMVKAQDAMEHKNAVVYGLVQGRDLIRNPRLTDYEKPHEIAFHFAEQVKDPNPHFAWDSQPFPKEILDGIYMSPQSSQANDSETGLDSQLAAGRKRKHINDPMKSSKRLKTSESAPPPSNLLVDADRHAAISPFVKIIGLHVLDVANAWNSREASIPERLLAAMCQKVTEDQLTISKEREIASDLRKVVQSMSKHITEYSTTLEREAKRLRESLEERAKFEIERNTLANENESLKAEVQNLKDQIQASQTEEKRRSEAATFTASIASATSLSTSNNSLSEATERIQEAEAKATSFEKRYASQSTEMEYFRQAYQDASNAASTLRKENTSLASQLQESQRSASDNILRIHDLNTKAQVEQLTRMINEAHAIQREREVDLERLRDELRVYKNGRRETRQSSAPRSPRVGMMSPRTTAAGFRTGGGSCSGPAPSSSRGTSPATLDVAGASNMQYFNTQQSGNGRWGHLKD
ncbi:hypothetical protein Cpir12675_003082 [Ceratocystis pirilliformis]|uniref:Chromo domain-containing protein n=1 Tax=Ceratocystis pirilliformis TaxID=259994 RepID=A0ABR3Z8F3_9PEZI